MNLVRLGRVVRSLRRHRGWRQLDLAKRAVCSQQAISLIECGHGDRLSLRTLERVLHALDAELDVAARWRGGQIERLLDEGHAALTGAIAARLERAGWVTRVEVSCATSRETGSIDLLGFHPTSGTSIVVEVKTKILSAEVTARKHDEKVRLAPGMAQERFGWRAANVARLLVLPDSPTARRQLARHDDFFGRVYPSRGGDLRRWLAGPSGTISGTIFLSPTKSLGARRALTSRCRIGRSSPPSR